MNRRGFLSFLGAAAVVPLVPMPELNLGRRIFLPPMGGWAGGNQIFTVKYIADEALRVFEQKLMPHLYDIRTDSLVQITPEQAARARANDVYFAPAQNESVIDVRRPQRYIAIGDKITIEGIRGFA